MKYFETQPRASTKHMRLHDKFVLLDVELIHKPSWDNIVFDALSWKEKFQVEKTPIKT